MDVDSEIQSGGTEGTGRMNVDSEIQSLGVLAHQGGSRAHSSALPRRAQLPWLPPGSTEISPSHLPPRCLEHFEIPLCMLMLSGLSSIPQPPELFVSGSQLLAELLEQALLCLIAQLQGEV